ncbi:MAG: hypothetical protein R3237_05710 [Nitrosopumilaceae archaeon]|nr:hypothetical protein [Nitrosopumilaceae archaeon]
MAMQEVKQRTVHLHDSSSKPYILSSTSLVACYVCGKGLQEGHSITAKSLPSGMVLFCNVHCPT